MPRHSSVARQNIIIPENSRTPKSHVCTHGGYSFQNNSNNEMWIKEIPVYGFIFLIKVLVNFITPEISINIRFDRICNQLSSRYLNVILSENFHHILNKSSTSRIAYHIKFYFSWFYTRVLYKICSYLYYDSSLIFAVANMKEKKYLPQGSRCLGGDL